LDSAAALAQLMQQFGVQREVIDTAQLLRLEPSLAGYGQRIVGATFTASDETGDARVFTQGLARACAARGVAFLFGHAVQSLLHQGGQVQGVQHAPVGPAPTAAMRLRADAVVLAGGSFTAPLLRTVGLDLPIYPGKGYSATFPILRPEAAPNVSLIDDAKKIAVTRLGDQIRVAGTIEVGDFDVGLDNPVAQARCRMLARRVEAIWPGMCDTRLPEEGGNPQFWAGLRPATPTNIPYIGQTAMRGLWVNAGHGTLGWTHGAGSGKALAACVDGERPIADFPFLA